MGLEDKTNRTNPATFTPDIIPDMPRITPSLLDVPGFAEQDRRWSEWWDSVKQQMFRTIQDDGINITRNAISIREETELRETADGWLSGKYVLTVTAGSVVTGMEITSAEGPNDGIISEVSFQADRFKIHNGTSGKIMFDVTGTDVRIGGTLVVDTPGNKVYIGAGNYANADTGFYVASTGNFSLKDKLVWNNAAATLAIDGTIVANDGAIGGWVIGATQLVGGDAILDSGGSLILGTGNDIVYLSASDATYRIWVGNASAGSAAFRVSKAGQVYATGVDISGTITSGSGSVGGFAMSPNTLSAGSGTGQILLDTVAGEATFGVGGATQAARFGYYGLELVNSSNVSIGVFASFGVFTAGYVQSTGSGFILPDGSTADPAIRFSSDPDTGIRWNSDGDMRIVTNGSDRLVIRDGAIVCLAPLKLDNNYVAGVVAAAGTVTIQDLSGTTYRLLCAP